MLEPVLVVSVGHVGAGVRAAALVAFQRAEDDGLSAVQHEAELQREDQVGVEDLALVVYDDLVVPGAQFVEIVECGPHPFVITEDGEVSVHRLAEIASDGAEELAATVAGKNVPNLCYVDVSRVVVDVGVLLGPDVVGGVLAGTSTEDEGVEERVRAEAVAAVDADTGRLARSVEAGHVREAVDIGLDAAHLVVHSGTYGDRLVGHVGVGEVDAKLADLAQLLVDEGLTKVTDVEEDAPVDSPALVDLRLLGSRDDVTGRKLHHIGGVPLHEALALGVEEVSALASRGLRQERAVRLEGSGMVLHHLHVHEGRSHLVGQGHAVAGADEGVGARLEDATEAPGSDDDRLCADDVDVARLHLHDDRAGALALFHDEREDEPLLVHADAEAQYLLVEDVEEHLSGEVGDEEGARLALSAEGPRGEPPLVVPAEYHPHVFHGDDLSLRLAGQDFDRVLVGQVVAALYGLEGVVFPRIASVGHGGVDAALRGVGVAPHGIDLGHHRHVHAVLAGRVSGPHSRQARPDHQHVMFIHPRLPRFVENLQSNISRCGLRCQGEGC